MKAFIILLALTFSSFSFAQSAACKSKFNAGVKNFDGGVKAHNKGVNLYNTIATAETTEKACATIKLAIPQFTAAEKGFTTAGASFKAAARICDPRNVEIAKQNTTRALTNLELATKYKTNLTEFQTLSCPAAFIEE